MKNILLDHFRRWRWIWLIGVVACLGLAVTACLPGKHPTFRPVFPMIVFLGPFLLLFDLQRGHARALLSMPVTTRETARAWWYATVAIPSLALAVLTGLGCAIVGVFTHGSVSYLAALNYWMLNSLFLGVMFFALTQMPARPAAASGMDRARAYVFGSLWGLLLAGWSLFSNFIIIEKTSGLVIYALGGILTVIGWYRAETMVLERAGLQGTTPATTSTAKPWRGREGYGGMRYLFKAVFQRLLLMGTWMFLFCSVFFWVLHHQIDARGSGRTDSFSFVPMFTYQLLWIMSLQILPVVFHVRFLRTLPVSSTRLASLLVFTPLAAMVTVVYITNLILSPFFGAPWFSPVEMLTRGYLAQIGIASCMIPILTWRGIDRSGYLIIFSIMIVGMLGSIFLEKEFTSLAVNCVAPFLVLGSFLMTRYLLERSSQAYRPRNNQMPGWNWSVGR